MNIRCDKPANASLTSTAIILRGFDLDAKHDSNPLPEPTSKTIKNMMISISVRLLMGQTYQHRHF